MTLRELLDRYAVLNNLSDRTVELYGCTLDRFRDFLRADSGDQTREPTVADLDDMVVSKFLRWRAKTPHHGRIPKPASVLKDRTQIVALWNFAARKRLAAEFPALARMRVAQRIPRAYTADDVAKMIRTGRLRRGTVGGQPAAWWWPTLIYTGYCTAERISAMLSLRWSEVDLDGCRVTFLGDTRKGGLRDIVREITPDLAKMLRARQRAPGELVWDWDRVHRDSIWQSLKLLCAKANVTYRGFHGLRRAAASYMAAGPGGRAAASALLDHSSPRLLEHYVDPAICPPERTSVESLPTLDLGWPTARGPESTPGTG
jgi:integrase